MAQHSSFYWYDLETFGIDPSRDRIVQFAGIRSDENLQIISDPLVLYCSISDDYLPHPESCLITGITPKIARQKGLAENTFIDKILSEFSVPKSCIAGYNNLRFDDEFIRYTLYRNFFDPYEREWKNGNSRWDIIDMVRMTYALRPDGISWPHHKDGRPSFKLEDLSQANNIQHDEAHDALSDVKATIEMAKLIKAKQPKLYHYVLQNKDKHSISQMLTLHAEKPLIHVSSKYPSTRFCTAVIAPLALHPTNKNGVVVFDLSADVQALIDLSVEDIKQRVFTPTEQLSHDQDRIPLKVVHINKCPVLAPISTLDYKQAERIGVDLDTCLHKFQQLRGFPHLEKKIRRVFSDAYNASSDDPEQNLYGGFFNDRDKTTMAHVRACDPNTLTSTEFVFEDKRLPELLFRYRARNFPDSLSVAERQRWYRHCQERLFGEENAAWNLSAFYQELNELKCSDRLDEHALSIVNELEHYGKSLESNLCNIK